MNPFCRVVINKYCWLKWSVVCCKRRKVVKYCLIVVQSAILLGPVYYFLKIHCFTRYEILLVHFYSKHGNRCRRKRVNDGGRQRTKTIACLFLAPVAWQSHLQLTALFYAIDQNKSCTSARCWLTTLAIESSYPPYGLRYCGLSSGQWHSPLLFSGFSCRSVIEFSCTVLVILHHVLCSNRSPPLDPLANGNFFWSMRQVDQQLFGENRDLAQRMWEINCRGV